VCKVGTDCAKGPCNAGVCGCTPLTCSDLQLVADATETDVDCGGPDCAPCDPGKTCLKPRDCASGSCGESGGAGLVCGALPP
jgi:hypothetical protein